MIGVTNSRIILNTNNSNLEYENLKLRPKGKNVYQELNALNAKRYRNPDIIVRTFHCDINRLLEKDCSSVTKSRLHVLDSGFESNQENTYSSVSEDDISLCYRTTESASGTRIQLNDNVEYDREPVLNHYLRDYEIQGTSLWFDKEPSVLDEFIWRCSGSGIKRKTQTRKICIGKLIRDKGSDDDLYESIYEAVDPPTERVFQNQDKTYENTYEYEYESDSDSFDDLHSQLEFHENLNQKDSELSKENGVHRNIQEARSLSIKSTGSHFTTSANSLTKFAEAFHEKADKKMRKFRNWSLKKNDISRSFSRKNAPRTKTIHSLIPSSGDGIFRKGFLKKPSFLATAVWKASPSTDTMSSPHSKPPSLKTAKHNKVVNTTFYITLNIKDKEEKVDAENKIDEIRTGTINHFHGLKRTLFEVNHTITEPTETLPHPEDHNTQNLNYQAIYYPSSVLSSSSKSFSHAPSLIVNQSSPSSSSSSLGSRSSVFTLDDFEENYSSFFFQTEPLYQFYDNGIDSDNEPLTYRSVKNLGYENYNFSPCKNIYESLNNLDNLNKISDDNAVGKRLPERAMQHQAPFCSRPSAMDLIQRGPGKRSMWGELPEVKKSGILNSISLEAKRLQEALFEVLSSEASYLKSLNVLISLFVQSEKLMGTNAVITKREHRILFSDIVAVRQVSESFLEDLEKLWQESVLLNGICMVIRKHADSSFQIYIKYCSKQAYQERMLKKLSSENLKFVETLKELESSWICQSLNMHSFLMLPMQRITRLPLLVGAILTLISPLTKEYEDCKVAYEKLNELVRECNESARAMERMEEMLLLSQKLDFKEVRAVPLISASRWLVKQGDVTLNWWKKDASTTKEIASKLTFGRKIFKQTLSFFLLTDMLIIAKRKSNDHYLVLDYCPRNLVNLHCIETSNIGPAFVKENLKENHMAWMTLLQNCEGKTIEWLVSFSTDSDRLRWLEAVTPKQDNGHPDEKIYESWDCPLVVAVSDYESQAEDELKLAIGQKSSVLRKHSDSGWCLIEKHCDGRKGWVPIDVIREIESNHVTARKYKQLKTFLTLFSSGKGITAQNSPIP